MKDRTVGRQELIGQTGLDTNGSVGISVSENFFRELAGADIRQSCENTLKDFRSYNLMSNQAPLAARN